MERMFRFLSGRTSQISEVCGYVARHLVQEICDLAHGFNEVLDIDLVAALAGLTGHAHHVFRAGVCILPAMNLSSLLSSIRHSEVLDARKQADHLSRRGKPLAARSKRIMEQYPAAGVIMSLPVKPGHDLFTKEKIEGYTAACRLLSSLAETRENADLQSELASITDEEMLTVVETMMSSDKMAFAEWFRSRSGNYYGYVLGMWENFIELLNSGKNDQCLGFLIVVGGLIVIAESRQEEAMPPKFP
jgi:hypothetical protein